MDFKGFAKQKFDRTLTLLYNKEQFKSGGLKIGTEKDITADDRAQSVEEDTEPSDEEKAQIAEKNHTCNGISVSGINLPWYVQFRAASGENYEFTNEAEANVFKSYDLNYGSEKQYRV